MVETKIDAPICQVCLGNDILCSGCRSKLEKGEITDADIEVSRLIHQLAQDMPSLRNITIKKVYRTTNSYVILAGEGDASKIVGKNGKGVKKISKRLNSSISIVEDKNDPEEIAKRLIAPAEVKSINTVFKPEGEEEKLIVDEDDKNRVSLSKEEFKEVLNKITGNDFSLAFK